VIACSRWRVLKAATKMAAEYERMARVACDEAFRAMYSRFARQWHEAAQQAEMPVLVRIIATRISHTEP
jgi:hypothetical protein